VLSIPSWFSLNTLKVDPLYAAFVRTPQFLKLEEKWGRRRFRTAQASMKEGSTDSADLTD
jgi:hypothetical protein